MHYNPLPQHTPQYMVFLYSLSTRRNEHKHIHSQAYSYTKSNRLSITQGSTLMHYFFFCPHSKGIIPAYIKNDILLFGSLFPFIYILFLFISQCIYQAFHKDWEFEAWDYLGFGAVSHFRRKQGVTMP